MMIFGSSPFGGSDQASVINQILNVGYDFPANTEVSNAAMDLIYLILNPEQHHFFNGPTPPGLPTYALTTAPNYNIISDPEVWNYIYKDYPIVTDLEIKNFIGSL
ncbi:9146_t:CDS:2 [Diversispora eburnea]|uniref:9146_t:CDS:1 n=1 Tax=Diversispora eburnea TaxID=1213867 RepID=A0A9N9D3E9_9GLOM|nr:9146_t:CDS:2 [Diversispora eburnea]